MKIVRKKRMPSALRVVLEVDGQPVGTLSLDMDRLWPLINHRRRERAPVEWLTPEQFDQGVQATISRRMIDGIRARLYRGLGDEIVRAKLDIENMNLRLDAVAEEFGRSKAEIEAMLQGSKRTTTEFAKFVWQCVLEERETPNLRKRWKSKASGSSL